MIRERINWKVWSSLSGMCETSTVTKWSWAPCGIWDALDFAPDPICLWSFIMHLDKEDPFELVYDITMYPCAFDFSPRSLCKY